MIRNLTVAFTLSVAGLLATAGVAHATNCPPGSVYDQVSEDCVPVSQSTPPTTDEDDHPPRTTVPDTTVPDTTEVPTTPPSSLIPPLTQHSDTTAAPASPPAKPRIPATGNEVRNGLVLAGVLLTLGAIVVLTTKRRPVPVRVKK